MREYQDNGVRLGWLMVPQERRVHLDAAGQAPRLQEGPTTLGDRDLLPGLARDLTRIRDARL